MCVGLISKVLLLVFYYSISLLHTLLQWLNQWMSVTVTPEQYQNISNSERTACELILVEECMVQLVSSYLY